MPYRIKNETPEQRVLKARLASHTSWANTKDRTARAAAGRAAFEKRFLDQVDPERVLPEAERNLRAASARKAFFTRLALAKSKAAAARRENAAA